MMNRYLLILTVLLPVVLTSCNRSAAPTKPFSRQLAQLENRQGQEAVTEACRLIDSVAVASPECVPAMIRTFCRTLTARQRTTEATAVASYLWGIDSTENPEIAARLLTSTLLPGTQAPAITGLAPAGKRPAYTILLFHESSCRTCQQLVAELGREYPRLCGMDVRVVSVSTDKDEKTWTPYAATLPWPDKLCDYRGFYSPNMAAWGVAATPTMFLVDRKGRVINQYGTMDRIWDLIFKNSK